MTDLSSLIERVKSAAGPDREIDVLVRCATGPFRAWSLAGGIVVPSGEPDYWVFNEEQAAAIISAYKTVHERHLHLQDFGQPYYTDPKDHTALYNRGYASIHKNINRRQVPLYTASLDATIALAEEVLPGAMLSFIERPEGDWKASVTIPDESREYALDDFERIAPTPSLALLLAILTALEAKNG